MSDKKKVWVHWGEKATRRDSPNAICEYKFATEAEVTAFLFGINEANGWLGATVWTELDLRCAEDGCTNRPAPCGRCWDDLVSHCAEHPHKEVASG